MLRCAILILTILLTFSLTDIFAQFQLKPDVIATSGGLAITDDFMISFTFGQAVAGNTSNESTLLTQGFQQPDNLTTGIAVYNSNIDFSVYPNPTQNLVTVEFTESLIGKIEVILTDLTGRRVPVSPTGVSSTRLTIDIGFVAQGTYLLQIVNETNMLSPIKIIKR